MTINPLHTPVDGIVVTDGVEEPTAVVAAVVAEVEFAATSALIVGAPKKGLLKYVNETA
jgi:hypothetical protein